MTYQLALEALADPNRRSLYERLRGRELPVGELARALRITQPAVSQHLRVLRRARLVMERREGTRHYFRAIPEGLLPLRRYLDAMWEDALLAYAAGTPRGTLRRPKPRKRSRP
jgi:DNA-binding transcriptional ArsR family regulator